MYTRIHVDMNTLIISRNLSPSPDFSNASSQSGFMSLFSSSLSSQPNLGNVLTGEYDLEQKARFAKATVYQKESCRSCWAKFYCSGGCNANNLQYAGDILRAHTLSCELEKKRLECALMIKAALGTAEVMEAAQAVACE